MSGGAPARLRITVRLTHTLLDRIRHDATVRHMTVDRWIEEVADLFLRGAGKVVLPWSASEPTEVTGKGARVL